MKVLLIPYVWPNPDASAAGFRTQNWIRFFEKQSDWELAFTSPSKPDAHFEKLQKNYEAKHFRPNDPAFDEWIRALQPNLVLFDRFVTEEQFGWRVKENCPHAVRWIDSQDLHFLRRSREQAHSKQASLEAIVQVEIPLEESDVLRELGSFLRSDRTFILSSFEMSLLENRFQFPSELISLLGFSYPDPLSNSPSFEERAHFSWIGNYRHAPNEDAVTWLKKELWAPIRKALPLAEIHLYGAYPSAIAMSWDDPSTGFRVRGEAPPDASQTLARYRVNLAPLRFGAGIKGKISDAWLGGTPTVTTPIGSEGMLKGVESEFGGRIARSASEFVEASIDLYSNAQNWNAAVTHGHKTLNEIFSEKRNEKKLNELLQHDLTHLTTHRERNWLGRLIWQDSLQRTRYFSKWIEEKEKNNELTVSENRR